MIERLKEITIDVLKKFRYIILPVSPGGHWFLLALDISRKKILYMNSIDTPRFKGAAARMIHLLPFS